MKLILFDIDGTLIDSAGAGTRSLNKAFYSLFSIGDAFKPLTLAGKTDYQIFHEGLHYHGIEAGDVMVERIRVSYLRYLRDEILISEKKIKPGIADLLRKISDPLKVGLLTGNLEEGAEIKLASLNIWHHFETGAFGSDHEDRVRLLPIAIEKCYRKYGIRFSFEDCVVIGDTPLDVACAKPYGARSIAVATGPYSYKKLLSTDADVVFEDLSDTDGVFSCLA